jgi:DNA repair exonuclease SbcCD ATPase subunit
MHISKLSTSPFKGRSISLALKRMNLITGDNLAGKTSVPDAVKVGTLGYVPKVGKTERATFELSSDPNQLNVQIEFSNGSANYAVLTKDKDGQVSRSLNFSVRTPAVMMDFSDYLRRTEQDKMAYVLGCVQPELIKHRDKDLLAELRKIEALPVAVAAPIIKATLKFVEDKVRERAGANLTVPEWMNMMIGAFKRKKREANETAKDKAASLNTLAQQAREEQPALIGPSKEELMQAHRRAERLRADFAAKPKSLDGDLVRQVAARDDARSRLAIARGHLEEFAAEERSMRKCKACPTCQSKGKAWLASWTRWNRIRVKETSVLVNELRIKAETGEVRAKQLQAEAGRFDALERDIDAAQASLNLLSERAEAANTVRRSSQGLRGQLEAESVAAITEGDVLDKFVEAFADAQQRLLDGTFGSLLATAKEFTAAFFRAPLEYRGGDLGYQRDGTWVSWRTFSGAEELFAFAGFSIALCQRAPFRLVVLDEFGRLTAKMKVKMVQVLGGLIERKVIDQVIVIDVDARDYKSVLADLNVIEIE